MHVSTPPTPPPPARCCCPLQIKAAVDVEQTATLRNQEVEPHSTPAYIIGEICLKKILRLAVQVLKP